MRSSKACGNTGWMTDSVSLTPFGLPGSVMIRVLPLTPQTDLLSMAIGVISNDFARMASANPGTSLSITERQASGVTSCRPNPVPPVLTIKSTVGSSDQSIICLAIMS